MALTKGDYLRPAKTLISGSIPTLTIAETTGQTFNVGELVKLTSGKILICETTDSAIKASNPIFGVTVTTGKALTSAVNSDSTGATQLVPAVGWMVFEAAVHNATTASAYIKTSMLGNYYSLYRSASNKIWYVNTASQSPVDCYVIGFRDATGSAAGHQGHVYITIATSARHAAWKV